MLIVIIYRGIKQAEIREIAKHLSKFKPQVKITEHGVLVWGTSGEVNYK